MLLEQLLRLSLLCLDLLCCLCVSLILISSHLLDMHLIRTINNSQRSRICPHVRQRGVLAQTCTAVGLHCTVEDSERHIRDKNFGGSDFFQGALGIGLVNLDGCIENN